MGMNAERQLDAPTGVSHPGRATWLITLQTGGDRLLAMLEKHVRLSLSAPFLVSGFLIIVYYLGGSDVRRLIDFFTFSK